MLRLPSLVANVSKSASAFSGSEYVASDYPPIVRRQRDEPEAGCKMDELNGKMIACQILVTGLIARVANDSSDPLRFLTDFRDEIKAVVKGINIVGMDNTDRVRLVAQQTVDELFSLMKPPSSD